MSASMAEVLARHRYMFGKHFGAGRVEQCSCGWQTTPDTEQKSWEAPAAHQEAVLAANGYGKLEDAPSRELKFLRGERKTLGKELDHFESQGHATVTIKYLRRFIGRSPE